MGTVYNENSLYKQCGKNNLIIMQLYKDIKDNCNKAINDDENISYISYIRKFLKICKEQIKNYSIEKEKELLEQADVLAKIVDDLTGKIEFQIVSLTPSTSISMNGPGIIEERTLAYEIIKETKKVSFYDKSGLLKKCWKGTANGSANTVILKVNSWKKIIGNFTNIADAIVGTVIDEMQKNFKIKDILLIQ